MTTVSKRAVVALATAAALLPAAPALAQTAPDISAPLITSFEVSPSTVVDVSSGLPVTPVQPVQPAAPEPPPVSPAQVPVDIDSEFSVINYGDTVLVAAFGAIGARADLYGNGRLIRSGGVLENQEGLTDGIYLWELQPGDTTTFSAVIDGVRTKNIVVRVRRTVTIGIRQASGIYTFTGTVGRAEAGLQVTVARLDAVTKRVTGVASARTNAAGNYTIRTRLPIGQAGYYALTAPTATLDVGRSRLYGLIVPRPAPRPVVTQTVTAPRPTTAPRPISVPISRPGDVDCSDFSTQRAAQAFYNRYVGQFGDFARLDGNDNDGRVCEALP